MKNLNNPSKIIIALLMLSALTLPFLLIVSIVCWILIGIIRFAFKEERNSMITILKENRLLKILPALYLFHVIGLLWTENFKYGGLDIQIKLTLFLLPIIIGTSKISKQERLNILKSFVVGCIITSIYLLIHSFTAYSETMNVQLFFYTGLCYSFLHPTYFTMYINLAIIILLHFIVTTEKVRTQSISGITLYFLLLMSILLSARTAQAAIVISTLLYILFQLKSIKLKQSGLTILLIVALMTVSSHILLTKINNRYTQVEKAIEDQSAVKEYNSTTARMEIWKEAFELIKENWLLGVGTGDVKTELVNTYKSHDFKYGYEKELNTHNEYIQIWLSIGFIGFLLLVLIHLLPIYQFNKYPDLIFPVFMMICGLNALTEATLETQRGVLFFAFFFSLMAVNSKASN